MQLNVTLGAFMFRCFPIECTSWLLLIRTDKWFNPSNLMIPQVVLKCNCYGKLSLLMEWFFFACLYVCKYGIVICDQEMNSFLPDFCITTMNCKDLLQHYTKTRANTTYDSLWRGDKKQLIDPFDPYLPLKNYSTQS